jgi:uncharacterized membrane protein (DUF2068 family)
MNDFAPTRSRVPVHHNKGLVLIAIFKLLQALLFIAIGIGALHLIKVDIDDLLARVLTVLRFNPESHFVNFVVEKASNLDDRTLRRISAVVFAYAGIALIEGVGLYLEKVWAEYLTLVLTASFLPLEILRLLHRMTWLRAGLLVLNMLVLVYLLKIVIERSRSKPTG